ncbi:MAG: FAD-dependent oxidoreductase [Ktedonobacteraceae bacterium]
MEIQIKEGISMTQHDVIVVGGGHNGLTAAAYLAKAGLDVLVLEAKEYVGGVITHEATLPGFQHDLHAIAHIFIQLKFRLKENSRQSWLAKNCLMI